MVNKIKAQHSKLPTDPYNGFAFPIATKFTIKLFETNSANHDCYIIEFIPFIKTIDTYKLNHLFSEQGEEGTISFYFCYNTNGETDKGREKT